MVTPASGTDTALADPDATAEEAEDEEEEEEPDPLLLESGRILADLIALSSQQLTGTEN